MPLLVVLSVIIAVFVVTRPGAGAGIVYYLKPDLSKISANAFLAALGQLFYSMSLAMGIMITYGSYMKKNEDIESSVRNIEIFDTGIAFLAGLMIVPAVFVFSGGDQASLFAALTSSISLMETVVSIFVDKTKKSRKFITVCVTVYTVLMAIPSSLGFGIWSGFSIHGMSILDFFDFISNSVLMPIVAFLTCVFVGFIVKPETITDEVESSTQKFKSKKLYIVLIKYVAPILVLLILFSSVLNALGIITL